jgi:hypothetical protein
VWRRYRAQIVITETSALGEARAPWLHELSTLAEDLLEDGVALEGICLYPILGMPEWHARDQWTRMGLWDLEREQQVLRRTMCTPMFEALRAAQRQLRRQPKPPRATRLVFSPTASTPLVAYGRILWKSPDGDGDGPRITLARSDHPERVWIAAIELRIGDELWLRVSTAAELSMILDQLRDLTGGRIASDFGVAEPADARDWDATWSRDVGAIAARARTLEAIPRCHADPRDVPTVVVGGRY